MREKLDPEGGFCSTQDADSEGEEAKFFVWAPAEIREVPRDDAEDLMAAYGVTQHGNFEGKNILEFVGDMDQRPALAKARRKLFEACEERVDPGRDEKTLTSWNGLMLAAFAEAARALDRDDGSRALAASYREVAERNADFLLRELRPGNCRLLRTWKRRPEQGEGADEAKLNGYLSVDPRLTITWASCYTSFRISLDCGLGDGSCLNRRRKDCGVLSQAPHTPLGPVWLYAPW